MLPSGQNQWFHAVKIMVFAGFSGCQDVWYENPRVRILAQLHRVQDDHLIPGHVNVEPVLLGNKYKLARGLAMINYVP